MSKLIGEVKLVERRMRSGYPAGVDEQSYRDIPLLLNRIQELESTLLPFAHVGNRPSEYQMVSVYYADCVAAKKALQTEAVPQPPADILGEY